MKRELSSFDIYVIVSELQLLVGSYVDKIYQLTQSELLIRINNVKTKKKEYIFIRNGELICLTELQLKTPLKPSTFAMTLRKYLQNGRITEICQHELDRIIKIKIGKKEGEYNLVVEFFSDGNIILVDPDDKIILPLIRQSWAHRTVKSKRTYVPPPPQIDPFKLSKQQFLDLFKKSDTDLVRTLAVNVNLSGAIAEEICFRAEVDKKTKVNDLNDKAMSKVFEALEDFLQIFKDKKFKPVFLKKNGEVVDILPFKFESYTHFDFEEINSMVKGLEKFIKPKKTEKLGKKKEESKMEKTLGRLHRQLSQQEKTIQKITEDIDKKKSYGDLIYLNYQKCEKLLEEIKQVLDLKDKEENVKKLNEREMVNELDLKNNILEVNLRDTDGDLHGVKLNIRKSVAENAEQMYKDVKKMRSKLRGANRAMKKTKEKIKDAEKAKLVEEQKREANEVKLRKKKPEKRFWFESYRWFVSSDGNVIVGGRDAKSNERVVKKYLSEGDRYAHADIQGAPSVVVKSKGVNDEHISISENTLNQACVFAASCSKAWKQFAEAEAYWVLPEQVSKTPQSGEFLPKGAFVIRGRRNYCKCKLELAVGMVKINDVSKVMAAPEDAVSIRSDKYVVIEPGKIKKNVFAHKLAGIFDVNVDQVDKVLPSGGVSVVKTVGFEWKNG